MFANVQSWNAMAIALLGTDYCQLLLTKGRVASLDY